jgi:hypothetical protein
MKPHKRKGATLYNKLAMFMPLTRREHPVAQRRFARFI